MTERIPILMEQVEFLKKGQEETRILLKEQIADLKVEHINDVRKNICRLWMAFDELRVAVNRITISVEKMVGIDEGRGQIARIVWAVAGVGVGAIATVIANRFLPHG